VKEVIGISDDFEIGYIETKKDLQSWVLQRARISSPDTIDEEIG